MSRRAEVARDHVTRNGPRHPPHTWRTVCSPARGEHHRERDERDTLHAPSTTIMFARGGAARQRPRVGRASVPCAQRERRAHQPHGAQLYGFLLMPIPEYTSPPFGEAHL